MDLLDQALHISSDIQESTAPEAGEVLPGSSSKLPFGSEHQPGRQLPHHALDGSLGAGQTTEHVIQLILLTPTTH